MENLTVLKIIVAEYLGTNPDEILTDAQLYEDLGLDSLDVTELILEVEERFAVEIPEAAVEKMRTVGDILTFLEGIKPL